MHIEFVFGSSVQRVLKESSGDKSMRGFLEYGVKDSTRLTISTLIGLFSLSSFAFIYWNISSLIESSASTFHSSWASLEFLILWRFTCCIAGAFAVVHMFKSGPGVMVVILHDTRKETTLSPVGIEKLVTFSSWTLLLNIMYFFIAGILSLSVMNGTQTPSWLNTMLVLLFSAALGASLLTATVVRYIILPGEVRIDRNHDQMFNFPNQMMHNFAAIFLILEVIFVQPELSPYFAFFGLVLGTFYSFFAYIFAFYGGGYYIYSFIDPRLHYGPLWLTGLAGAIGLFYLGVWCGLQLIAYNFWIGTIVFMLWLSLIVQFRTTLTDPVNNSGSVR
tara:strand:+ start:1666 stop:2664 length:999 start_codon:yes stop_codon:yes gene_type:complete